MLYKLSIIWNPVYLNQFSFRILNDWECTDIYVITQYFYFPL